MNKKFYAEEGGWTKEMIFDQLDRDGGEITEFTADDISDADAQSWVNNESDIRDSFPDEEDYVDEVIALNDTLINNTCKRLKTRSK